MKSKIIFYWVKLSPREKIMVTFATIILLATLIYSITWSPMQNQLAIAQEDLIQKKEMLTKMRQLDAAQPNNTNRGDDKTKDDKTKNSGRAGISLVSTIEKSAKLYQFEKSIQSLSPNTSQNEVRVLQKSVSFNSWLKWIDELASTHNITVKSANIQRDKDGLVDVQATFKYN